MERVATDGNGISGTRTMSPWSGFIYLLNMDVQDGQDNRHGRLLHERLSRAMIAWGFADVQDYKPAVSGKNPVHPVHPC